MNEIIVCDKCKHDAARIFELQAQEPDDTEIQVWSSSSLQHVVLSQYWGDPPNAHILYIDIELTDSVDDIETGVG
jgi:hypothetical protein